MKALLLCAWLLWPTVAAAQVLPALYDVAGVAGDDVLNIRANADASSPVLASLPADATSVEVVALSPDGKWAQLNAGESSGWAALRFLQRQDRPDWFTLEYSLQCSGTEPFWTLFIEPQTKSAHINTPDEEGPELDIAAQWPGNPSNQTAAVQYSSEDAGGIAVLRGQACSDGMSDQNFGIALDLFKAASANQPAQTLHGCCNLAP
ncbi:hypothetical protein GCM10010873_11540 [Cypionkella aquatica]|uniref:SH3b domain-containing protein n=1 Tax=Cypionkella aquatica TaxID=1756042 RepID=A0AA37X0V3_9RHOB|nr:SH3 domain-containing protein [Cypionkella aquatica]GLS86180.1 hypothetical protein GCM10010873_11540 [Cypionkella aquatica]